MLVIDTFRKIFGTDAKNRFELSGGQIENRFTSNLLLRLHINYLHILSVGKPHEDTAYAHCVTLGIIIVYTFRIFLF